MDHSKRKIVLSIFLYRCEVDFWEEQVFCKDVMRLMKLWNLLGKKPIQVFGLL